MNYQRGWGNELLNKLIFIDFKSIQIASRAINSRILIKLGRDAIAHLCSSIDILITPLHLV